MRDVRLELMMAALVLPLLTIAADAQSGAGPHHAVSAARPAPGLVDHVREGTEKFRDVNQTPSGGYFPFLGCVSGPQEGAMGIGLDPFYELHVWAWQHNPHGAFVDWNTLVSCEGR